MPKPRIVAPLAFFLFAIILAFLVRFGQFNSAAKFLGITSGSRATDDLFGIGAVYLSILAFNIAFSLLDGKNLGQFALEIARGFGKNFFKRTLPVALALFLPTYALFYFVFAGILPYPETSLKLIPIFFIVRFAIAFVEEGFFRGALQDSFGEERRGLVATTVLFAAYFALTTKFLPLFPNFILGLAVGSASGYLHLKNGGFGSSTVMRAIYETLILLVLV